VRGQRLRLPPDGRKIVSASDDHTLKLWNVENRHDGWREHKERDGWSYGPVRDDVARQHPCLVEYATLSEEEKEKDRNSVHHYPDILELAGCRIVEAGSPVRADTR
jgi:hypothetical protein